MDEDSSSSDSVVDGSSSDSVVDDVTHYVLDDIANEYARVFPHEEMM